MVPDPDDRKNLTLHAPNADRVARDGRGGRGGRSDEFGLGVVPSQSHPHPLREHTDATFGVGLAGCFLAGTAPCCERGVEKQWVGVQVAELVQSIKP